MEAGKQSDRYGSLENLVCDLNPSAVWPLLRALVWIIITESVLSSLRQ